MQVVAGVPGPSSGESLGLTTGPGGPRTRTRTPLKGEVSLLLSTNAMEKATGLKGCLQCWGWEECKVGHQAIWAAFCEEALAAETLQVSVLRLGV